MQSHDLRRLITTFLVLALVAGSATLAVTSLARQESEGPAALAREATEKQLQVPRIGDEALVETLTSNPVEGYDLAKEFSPTITTKDNYTDTLAKGLAYEFVVQNPEGPQDGFGITPPGNLEEIMDEYITEAALVPTTYAIDETRVRIARTYTTAQAQQYFATMSEVINRLGGESGVGKLNGKIAADGIDDAAMQASHFIFSDAQDQLYDTTVPAPAAEVHRAMLTYLELNKKLASLEYNTDPLKALVFVTRFSDLNRMEQARLTRELAKLEQIGEQISLDAREPFVIASALGISSAHAAVGAATVEPGPGWAKTLAKQLMQDAKTMLGVEGNWKQKLLEFARKVATQVLKNQIVGRMIRQTIQWVQGGGKPQFVTNWKKFLLDAGSTAASITLSGIAPRLCESFRPFVMSGAQAALANRNNENLNLTCTLDRFIQNVRAFYEDFQNGGWLGLFTLIENPNNLFGSIIATNERIAAATGNSQTAASAEIETNDQYKGTSRCVQYDLLEVLESEIGSLGNAFVGLGPRGCVDSDLVPDNAPPGTQQVRICEVKVCRPDGRQTTTPGGHIAEQVEKALGSSVDTIINAEDLAELVGVLVDAAITRLIGLAERGILGLFNGDGAGEPPTPPGGGLTGGNGTGTGDLTTQAGRFLDQVASGIASALSTAANWATEASSTGTLLSSMAATCPNMAAEANARASAISAGGSANSADQSALNALNGQLSQLRAAIQASTDPVQIADLMSQASTLSGEADALAARIASRNSQLSAIAGAAQANITGSACNVELPDFDG